MKQMDVIGLGYAGWDYLGIVPQTPQFDASTMTLAGFARSGGGPAATALVTLARLGARTGYLGVLGDDESGKQALADLRHKGVDTSHVVIRPGARSHTCMVLVEAATGRRSILCERGTLGKLVLTLADHRYISNARFLHLDGQFMDAAITAARWAKKSGVRVSLDANRPRPQLDKLLPLVHVLITSTGFPAAFTGLADLTQAMRALRAAGPETVVVTLGQEGCTYLEGDKSRHVPAYPVKVIDTTGAGDAFHGAYLFGLLQGWQGRQTARFANAVAGLNCRALGGRAALPTLTEVQAFLRQMG